ncbi:MAG: T9SS type A sorting domain-containing protein [Taibaiella sp.]|nr:T9SS type A sorting domain-containing protein [Taibaiella sp.]
MKKLISVVSLALCGFFCTSQTITTVVGGGTGTVDGTPATAASAIQPKSVVSDENDVIYFVFYSLNKVWKVDHTNTVSTLAGNGTSATSGDGGPATSASVISGRAIARDRTGNVYFSTDKRIRMVNTAGIISTFAGNGSTVYSGDGGPATAAGIGNITCITFDTAGNAYLGGGIHDNVRKVEPSGIISVFAGTGVTGFSGDGGPATNAQVYSILDIATDYAGNVFIADEGNQRVRKVDPSGIITTVAGNGTIGYAGDGGPATAAQLSGVHGVAWAGGYLYIGERGNNRIRQVDPAGIITTIAGNGSGITSGDGGPATAAGIAPGQLFRYGGGSLYVCDVINNRIRKITMPNNAPFFTAGEMTNVCTCGAEALNIDTTLRVMDADNLQPMAWSLASPPMHGVALASCNRISTGGVLTPSGVSYAPASGYTGLDTFTVRVNDGGASDTITVVVHIETFPIASPISGPDTICIGDTTLFSAGSMGVWSASGASVSATGGVSATATGTATITYTVSNFCGTDYSTHNVTILPAGECPVAVRNVAGTQGILIYPNPSNGTFTIFLPKSGDAQIVITDVAGRAVKTVSTEGSTTMQLREPPGVYILTAYMADGVVRGKVVMK